MNTNHFIHYFLSIYEAGASCSGFPSWNVGTRIKIIQIIFPFTPAFPSGEGEAFVVDVFPA